MIAISFAKLAANVFVHNGVKVFLFQEFVPTPVVVSMPLIFYTARFHRDFRTENVPIISDNNEKFYCRIQDPFFENIKHRHS